MILFNFFNLNKETTFDVIMRKYITPVIITTLEVIMKLELFAIDLLLFCVLIYLIWLFMYLAISCIYYILSFIYDLISHMLRDTCTLIYKVFHSNENFIEENN
jgi:hypothetical protein